MSDLTIVARITAAEGQGDLVRSEATKLIDVTRSEPGCIRYDLHVDNEQPGHFLFYETWQSRELWQDHMNAEPLKAFKAATDGKLAETELYEMTQIA